MHDSSKFLMAQFAAMLPAEARRVLDVGSQDVNGSYRDLFADREYTGLDIAPGENVDVVVADPYHWKEFGNRHFTDYGNPKFDVVISGQCLEHVEYPWLTVAEMFRVLRPGGWLCVIVPANGPEHGYPIDCYRFFPSGLTAIAKLAGFAVTECVLHRGACCWDWDDTRLIARKPE